MSATKEPKVKRTESELLSLLRARHGEVAGNGAAYAFVTRVRSAAGFDARRTLDAVSMCLWPSRGLLLDGFEVKCSRSDWQRELKNPEKAEEFCRLLDRFWIVAGDKDIVREGELPPNWGLLVARGNGLTVATQALPLRESDPKRSRPLPEGFSRSFLACLLREAVRVGAATPREIHEAEERGAESVRRSSRLERETWKPRYEELYKQKREFEEALGYPISGYNWGDRKESPKEVGNALRMVLNGEAELDGLKNRFSRIAENAENIAKAARERADAIDTQGPTQDG